MKNAITLLLLCAALSSFAQSGASSVNSGAVANSGMIYTVGEIFVLPVSDPNEANSGLIGVLSRVEFLVTGLNEALYTDELKAYPNPVSQSVYFETRASAPITTIYVYDVNGRLALAQTDVTQSVDMSGLTAGTYFIRTSISDSKSFKIIKQ